ncbi:MAG: hypothetical protein Q6351_001405 [Candidatus Njordarchaeum guaymaensis]
MILTSRLFRKIKSFFLHMIGKKDIDEMERKLGIINTSPGTTSPPDGRAPPPPPDGRAPPPPPDGRAPPPPPDGNRARERRKP